MDNITYHETVEVVNLPSPRRRRISWGAIIGGVITVLAVYTLWSLIGMAIGLWAFDPDQARPMAGMGTGMIVWTIISLLLSLAAGGFIAGKLAGSDGMIHGFLTWATTLIAGLVLMGMLVSGASKWMNNMLTADSSMTGQILSGAKGMMRGNHQMMGREIQNVFGGIDCDGECAEMRPEITRTMRRSGVKEFQPEYVKRQMRALSNDYHRTIDRSVANPHRAEQHIDGFLQRTNERANKVFRIVDRTEVAQALADNPKLTQAEAEDLVDYYVVLAQEGRDHMQNVHQNVKQARQEWDVRKTELRHDAEKRADMAAWRLIWLFVALMLGAAAAAICGMLGTRMSKEGVEV